MKSHDARTRTLKIHPKQNIRSGSKKHPNNHFQIRIFLIKQVFSNYFDKFTQSDMNNIFPLKVIKNLFFLIVLFLTS